MIGAVDDEQRWAAATARLVAGPTPEEEQRDRYRRRRVWLLAGVLTVVAVGAGIAVGLLSGDEPEPDPEIARWRELTGLALSLGGLLGLLVGGVVAWRSGLWGHLWRWPTRGLSRAQQRLLNRQVQGKVPTGPRQLPLARALAHRLALQDRLGIMWAGLGVQQVGQLVRAESGGDLVLPSLVLALLLAAVVAVTVQARRARRFLAAHPARDDAGLTPHRNDPA